MNINIENTGNVAKIYKLFTPDNEYEYYGSTKTDLRMRLAQHKIAYNRWKNGKGCYVTSYKLFETEMPVDIVLVEKVTGDKEEIKARERYHIEADTCVNKNRPGRTQDQYYIDTKDERLEYQKAYHEANKENKKAYDRERYNKLKALAQSPQNPEE